MFRVHFGRHDALAECDSPALRPQIRPAFFVEIVNDRTVRQQILEQPCLGAVVRVHRAVIVQMIAREVREHDGVELDAIHATLIEGMRGDLHRDPRHAPVDEQTKEALELDRPRSR